MPDNPIAESLPYDGEIQPGTQLAWHAVVHLVVPCIDTYGTPVNNLAEAEDYISETLRGRFLDWGYVRATDLDTGATIAGPDGLQTPIPITVCKPYVEGTFLTSD